MLVHAPNIEGKIIGVLLRAARERSHRTLKQVAQRLGVSKARVRAYESGAREISLPELEIMALYFQVPLSYFIDPDSKVQEDRPTPPLPEELKSLRLMIGTRLKQARLAANKSREECAEVAQIKPSIMARYERGLADISIFELERLGSFLSVNLFYFLQNHHVEPVDVLDLEKLAQMPKDVRIFALNADNLPYLRIAQKFRDLPHDKVKELGEIFLNVR